jgi:hypothetical protein
MENSEVIPWIFTLAIYTHAHIAVLVIKLLKADEAHIEMKTKKIALPVER